MESGREVNKWRNGEVKKCTEIWYHFDAKITMNMCMESGGEIYRWRSGEVKKWSEFLNMKAEFEDSCANVKGGAARLEEQE